MKTMAAWILILWIALVAERGRPDLLPSGCLIVPLAVICIFWLRSASGVFLSGFALTIQWILIPTASPLPVAIVLLNSAWFLTRPTNQREWSGGVILRHSWWLQPLTVTAVGLVWHVFAVTPEPIRLGANAIGQRLVISLPCLFVMIVLMRVSDEFGLLRTHRGR